MKPSIHSGGSAPFSFAALRSDTSSLFTTDPSDVAREQRERRLMDEPGDAFEIRCGCRRPDCVFNSATSAKGIEMRKTQKVTEELLLRNLDILLKESGVSRNRPVVACVRTSDLERMMRSCAANLAQILTVPE